MKLTTALIVGIFTVGSSSVLAGHGHDGDSWDFHKSYRHAQHHHRKAYKPHTTYKWVAHKPRHKYGEVIHVEPVYHTYTRPARETSCLRSDGQRAQYVSHTGAILGAVIGGALGHRIGDAHGDPGVAAIAGGVLGAAIGNDLSRSVSYNRSLHVNGPCRVNHRRQTVRELVEYKVTYRYNGTVHVARMDHDPGAWVKLDVEISPA